jgi:hydrogenase nickel incorporation protein HypA/HybF
MPEMGIIIHLVDTLEQTARENNIVEIGTITLQIGEVSGVVYDYFEDCWNWMKKKHPVLALFTLMIQVLPAVTSCSRRGKNSPSMQYDKICPYCGSGETWLGQGNQ